MSSLFEQIARYAVFGYKKMIYLTVKYPHVLNSSSQLYSTQLGPMTRKGPLEATGGLSGRPSSDSWNMWIFMVKQFIHLLVAYVII